MAKVACHMFKDPQNAEAAIKGLEAKGFKKEEIGVVARDKSLVARLAGIRAATTVKHPEMGEVATAGPLAEVAKQSGKDGGLAATLLQALQLPEEWYSYYEFGISVGGVLVTAHTSDQRLEKARQILRAAEGTPVATPVKESSPGFLQAQRMSGTNPVDAPMSGDFRKY